MGLSGGSGLLVELGHLVNKLLEKYCGSMGYLSLSSFSGPMPQENVLSSMMSGSPSRIQSFLTLSDLISSRIWVKLFPEKVARKQPARKAVSSSVLLAINIDWSPSSNRVWASVVARVRFHVLVALRRSIVSSMLSGTGNFASPIC